MVQRIVWSKEAQDDFLATLGYETKSRRTEKIRAITLCICELGNDELEH